MGAISGEKGKKRMMALRSTAAFVADKKAGRLKEGATVKDYGSNFSESIKEVDGKIKSGKLDRKKRRSEFQTTLAEKNEGL